MNDHVADHSHDGAGLRELYEQIRGTTHNLIEPLSPEDCLVQSMPDASPTKWHLAHTTWFFETFFLRQYVPNYQDYCDSFLYLFNSYYNGVGEQYPRPGRGLISRPSLQEVIDYRRSIDECVLEQIDKGVPRRALDLITLGLHHEQQHQELILTDVKHMFSLNPGIASYLSRDTPQKKVDDSLFWVPYEGGVFRFGHEGKSFCFDNEYPNHEVLLSSFLLASRLTTNLEFQQFIEDGGYNKPELWLSEGWEMVRNEGWTAPLYWQKRSSNYITKTLWGTHEIVGSEPVVHLSFYEADAFSRWAGSRLATEYEWEHAASNLKSTGNFLDSGNLHPSSLVPDCSDDPKQMFGDVWEWTASPYVPYPGYRPAEGAVGEYNGKFMCNQYVLRGGSCVTPQRHIRPTYRNFFPAHARWQFSGLRLAKDA